MLLPLLAAAAVVIVGVAWYEKNKKASAPSPATAAAAGLAVAQAGYAVPGMHHYHGAHVPHIEDQMGALGMLTRSHATHVPHIEDMVGIALLQPQFGLQSPPSSPVWHLIPQSAMPLPAQADLLKQVRLKNVRGFYKTNLGLTVYALFVGDTRDMRTYLWYRGPMVPWAQQSLHP